MSKSDQNEQVPPHDDEAANAAANAAADAGPEEQKASGDQAEPVAPDAPAAPPDSQEDKEAQSEETHDESALDAEGAPEPALDVTEGEPEAGPCEEHAEAASEPGPSVSIEEETEEPAPERTGREPVCEPEVAEVADVEADAQEAADPPPEPAAEAPTAEEAEPTPEAEPEPEVAAEEEPEEPPDEDPAELQEARANVAKLMTCDPPPKAEDVGAAAEAYSAAVRAAVQSAAGVDEALHAQIVKLREAIGVRNEEDLEAERKEYTGYCGAMQDWAGTYDSLFESLTQLIDAVNAVTEGLDENADDFQAAPEELGKALLNRKTGLSMVGRMLSRLPAKRKDPQETSVPELIEDPLADVQDPAGADEVADFVKQCAEAYQKGHDANYVAGRDASDAAEKVRKEALSSVEHGLLPAIDGIDSGIGHADALKAPLLERHTEHEALIEKWFGSYNEFYDQHVKPYFEKTGIEKLPTEPGMPFNEEIHSALGTTSEGDFENEQIASVARNGYKLREVQVRAAEVEVFMA